MFLSKLVVNIGEDPTRYRPAREWLRNLYRVHQRLWMGFAGEREPVTGSDTDYPYSPDRLEHAALPKAPFLFRVETYRPAVILVQSILPPLWERAFWNAEYLLDQRQPWLVKDEYEPAIECGLRFSFRLLANPVRKVATIPKKRRERPDQPGRHGRRVPVPPESFGEWLSARSEAHGFRLVAPIQDTLHMQVGYVYVNKTRDPTKGQRLRSVRYDGLLEVLDEERFRESLLSGIGPAKAFGFGLLSIAPVRI